VYANFANELLRLSELLCHSNMDLFAFLTVIWQHFTIIKSLFPVSFCTQPFEIWIFQPLYHKNAVCTLPLKLFLWACFSSISVIWTHCTKVIFTAYTVSVACSSGVLKTKIPW